MKLDLKQFHAVDARLPKTLAGPSLFYYRAVDDVAVVIGTTTMPMVTKADDGTQEFWAVFHVSVISSETVLTKEQCGECIAEACNSLDLTEYASDGRVAVVCEFLSTADRLEKGTDKLFSAYLRISYDDFLNNVSKATDIYEIYKTALSKSKHDMLNKGVMQ